MPERERFYLSDNPKFLVVGSGGREEAIAQSLIKYSGHGRVKEVFIAPGNAGTEFIKPSEPDQRVVNIEIPNGDVSGIVDIAKQKEVDMVIVGSEMWLEKELGDVLKREGIRAIAPEKNRAMLELDKVHARLKCDKWGVPQPRFKWFSDTRDALHYIEAYGLKEGVVKVAGPALGKGVTVCDTHEELKQAVIDAKEKFGSSADKILIEERLKGQEVSYIVLSDGKNFAPFVPAMDFKFLNGKTTGGMASLAPNPFVTSEITLQIEKTIVKPVISGMRREGTPYVGVLYFGIMLTEKGPMLIEMNVRLGDSETQVQLPLMREYLQYAFTSVINGDFEEGQNINNSIDSGAAAIITLASEGYPDSSKKGVVINGLDTELPEGVDIVHSGTKREGENIVTNGGRVLGVRAVVSGLKDTIDHDQLKTAIERAYSVIGDDGINFEAMQYLKNIVSPEIIEKAVKQSRSYASSGVKYTALDHVKRMAQDAIRTHDHLKILMGITDVPTSRGESAHLMDMGNFYTASVVEGLGTKNIVADDLKRLGATRSYYDVAAWDTVAMVVNDLITVGAEPLVVGPHWAAGDSSFFEDEKLRSDLIGGWMGACHAAGVTYGPGETAVLKEVINSNTVELSGFGYGIINPKYRYTFGYHLHEGDHIVLIESSGIHANGITLARQLANEPQINITSRYFWPLSNGKRFGEAIMTPTHIYANLQRKLYEKGADINYMANITGHGWRKLMRADYDFTYRMHKIPPISSYPEFQMIQEWGQLTDEEMYSTFNMGAGFAFYVPESSVDIVREMADEEGFRSWDAGIVEKGPRQVIIEPKGLSYSTESLQIR